MQCCVLQRRLLPYLYQMQCASNIPIQYYDLELRHFSVGAPKLNTVHVFFFRLTWRTQQTKIQLIHCNRWTVNSLLVLSLFIGRLFYGCVCVVSGGTVKAMVT